MIYRLLAILAAIVLVFQIPSRNFVATGYETETKDTPIHAFVNLETIRHLYCHGFTGTGDIIYPDIVLTAAHVIDQSTDCIDGATGEKGRLIAISHDLDFAVLEFPKNKLPHRVIPYSCIGFIPGKTYYAIGWANGKELVINKVIGSGVNTDLYIRHKTEPFRHVTMVLGEIIPGMSGGPIVDENGVLIGMNQATNNRGIGWSKSIRDTPLCGKS